MTQKIFPTNQNVGYGGDASFETEMSAWIAGARGSQDQILSGMAASDGGGLNVTVALGTCTVSGYRVELTASETVAVNNNETDACWYLQLVKSGSKVTGTQWVRVLDPDVDGSDDPSDACAIFFATTSGGSISSVSPPRRPGPANVIGDYTGDGTNPRTITLGFKPSFVIISGETTPTGGRIFSLSGIEGHVGCYSDKAGNVGTSTSQTLVPVIVNTGFQIGDAGAESTNNNTSHYTYIAFL